MYKKNVASQSVYFVMVGIVSPSSPSTGVTVTAKRSIDGGAIASCTGTIVEDGNGMYHLLASAADLNGNNIGFIFTGASNYPHCVNVQTADGSGIWDVLTADHTTTGSTGKAMGDAASGIVPNTVAAAVWNYLTSAMSTVGSIGVLLATMVDAAISSRLAEAAYTGSPTGDIALIKAKTDNLPAAPAAVSDVPTANAVADALLDRADGVQASWTLRQALRIVLAALGGKVSGADTTTITFRDPGDTKNRIVATVDGSGNRSSVTYDVS
jgi:hypothetical protein